MWPDLEFLGFGSYLPPWLHFWSSSYILSSSRRQPCMSVSQTRFCTSVSLSCVLSALPFFKSQLKDDLLRFPWTSAFTPASLQYTNSINHPMLFYHSTKHFRIYCFIVYFFLSKKLHSKVIKRKEPIASLFFVCNLGLPFLTVTSGKIFNSFLCSSVSSCIKWEYPSFHLMMLQELSELILVLKILSKTIFAKQMLIIIINIFIIIVYLPVLEHKFQESRKLVSIVHWCILCI